MGDGRLGNEDLSTIMAFCRDLPGVYGEIGVFRGNLFQRLVRYGKEHGKTVHAFDSFVGLAKPGEFDNADHYEAGTFDIGGVSEFRKLVEGEYETWEGFIPACFDGFPDAFSFVYIDLDHYEPTRLAIEWACQRLQGVIGFDDYFEQGIGASKAIDEFLRQKTFEIVLHNKNNQIFLKKR